MIRIYIDSDVLNNLRKGELSKLSDFFISNRKRFLIAFSHAHIQDKMPSRNVAQEKFWSELDFITEFTQSKLISFDQDSGKSIPCEASARQILEAMDNSMDREIDVFDIEAMIKYIEKSSEEFGKPELGKQFREIFEMPALAHPPEGMEGQTYKDQLQKAANSISDFLYKPESYKASLQLLKQEIDLPSHSGNWKDSVIEKIDSHIKQNSKYSGFSSLVSNNSADKSTGNLMTVFTQYFQTLNMVGYKTDDSKKGFMSTFQDACHSFYGAHCDYLITMDKKLAAKSKALYEHFGLKSKVVSPDEFLEDILASNLEYEIHQVFVHSQNSEPIDRLFENGVYKTLHRLNGRWLDYFTHIQYDRDADKNHCEIIMRKINNSYSTFMFYEEVDTILTSIYRQLGLEFELDSVLKTFKDNYKEEPDIEFKLPNGTVKITFTGSEFILFFDLTKGLNKKIRPKKKLYQTIRIYLKRLFHNKTNNVKS